MMPTSKTSFLGTAAALALAWSMLGPLPTFAQDDQGDADRTAAGAALAEAPPAATSTARAVVPVSEPPTSPPRNLKKVGDHWTPYDPPDPESFPPDATLHIIVPGETLWGLSDLTYNNPYLWPQLWDQNRYIRDSHWIYPGDPLLLPPRPVVVTEAGEQAGVPTEIVPLPQEGAPPTALDPMSGNDDTIADDSVGIAEPLAAAMPEPAADRSAGTGGAYPGGTSRSGSLVDLDEIRCSGFIAEGEEPGDLFIAENDEPVYENITLGGLLYLNRGRDDDRVVPGAVFSVVEREGTVLHPVSGRTQGRYYRRSGEVRVLKVLEDTAIATVSFACDEIRVGDELIPVDAEPVPARTIPPLDRLRVEPNGKPTGYVIHTKDTVVHVATGDMVQIDLGRDDGLAPGDFLTAFAEVHSDKKHVMPDYKFRYGTEIFARPDVHDDGRTDYPALPVAQLVVVTTGQHTATAKIVHALREITVGSLVEID